MIAPIQNLINQYNDVYKFLLDSGQVSQSIILTEHYRKIILLSCASSYESQITIILQTFVASKCSDSRIFNFVNNKAINRQYHTYFQWDERNINSFLGIFGPEFKNSISTQIKSDDELCNNVKAFLEIGAERNRMVHGNFLEYQLNKTIEEIIELNNKAEKFVEYLKSVF